MSGIDLEVAVELYYRCTELGSKEIGDIFRCKASKVYKLKLLAREQMTADGVKTWDARNVDTECAFKAWGLDIGSLERRLTHLRRIQNKGVINNGKETAVNL